MTLQELSAVEKSGWNIIECHCEWDQTVRTCDHVQQSHSLKTNPTSLFCFYCVKNWSGSRWHELARYIDHILPARTSCRLPVKYQSLFLCRCVDQILIMGAHMQEMQSQRMRVCAVEAVLKLKSPCKCQNLWGLASLSRSLSLTHSQSSCRLALSPLLALSSHSASRCCSGSVAER